MAAKHRASDASEAPRLRLVFMGTPPFAARCLERLLAGPHRVGTVVTQPDRPAGRGHKPQPSAVKTLAERHGLEILQPAKASDPALAARLRELAPDLAVVVAYGEILRADVIAIARLGCINAHGSLLPELRGAAPIERAILEGKARTGVTIMQINERMDAGDMIASRAVDIGPTTDAEMLRESLSLVAADLLAESVDHLACGTATFTPQDESRASYAPRLETAEARIDWSRPARDVDRQIRAFRPRPGAFTFDAGRRLKIVAAAPLDATADAEAGTILGLRDEAMLVACGEGVLRVQSLQPEGKQAMAATAYLHGRALPLPRRLDTDS